MALSKDDRRGLLYVTSGAGALFGGVVAAIASGAIGSPAFAAIGVVPACFLAVFLTLLCQVQKADSLAAIFCVSGALAFGTAYFLLYSVLEALANAR